MVEFFSGIWLYATIILAFILLAFSCFRISKMKRREQELVAAAVVIGLLLFIFEHVDLYTIAVLEIGILAFNGLLSGETSKIRGTYVSVSLLYIALIHWTGFVLIAQTMLIGIMSGITNIREYKNRIENSRVEINRDVLHIAVGILLILVFYFESNPVAITTLILLIMGGILTLSMTETYKGNYISRLVYSLERNGATLGHGAQWLALGSLFAVSFLSTPGVIVVFAAIFIGDPAATIIGVSVGGRGLG